MKYLLIFMLLFFTYCSESTMNDIDTNPNNPTDVPLKQLIPQITLDVAFSLTGTDLAWYSSILVEHTCGVYDVFQSIDKHGTITPTMLNNSWIATYQMLKDMQIVIEKGTKEQNWIAVGIGKTLTAYTLGVATDIWGKIPYSEALQGSANLYPKFDSQESIYTQMQSLLDEAITNFEKDTSSTSLKTVDLIYSGDSKKWKAAAYGLKARYYNRLSKIEPANSATKALEALKNAFTSTANEMVFSKFESSAKGEHPWYQQQNDCNGLAISKSFLNTLEGLNDPRENLFCTRINGEIVGAANGLAADDQSGTSYSRPSVDVVYATAQMPLLTFSELKFIEAEANLRLGNNDAAYLAYQEAVRVAMEKVNVTENEIKAYLFQTLVLPSSSSDLTLNHIITQKYIAFWLFQPIEAYNDWRRTGIPTLKNALGEPIRRFPVGQDEYTNNKANCPDINANFYTSGVWWDLGTENQ